MQIAKGKLAEAASNGSDELLKSNAVDITGPL